ncbi:hypothetical protein O9992_16285 [Vibrio lentus]|nr:hypothetical protein [Vibrio lentus]
MKKALNLKVKRNDFDMYLQICSDDQSGWSDVFTEGKDEMAWLKVAFAGVAQKAGNCSCSCLNSVSSGMITSLLK